MLQEPSFYEIFLAVWCYHKYQLVCDKSPVSTQLCLQYVLSQEPTYMLHEPSFYDIFLAVWCYHKNQPVSYKSPVFTQLCLQYDVTRTKLYVTRAQFLRNIFSSMMLSQEPICMLQEPSLYKTVLAVWFYHTELPVCYNSPVSTQLCLQYVYIVVTRTNL